MSSKRGVFMALGLLLIVGALIQREMTAAFLHRAARTTGTVEDPGPGGRHPTIHFQLTSGRTIGLVGGSVFVPLRAGQAVPIAYDPADPVRSAVLDRPASLWFPAVLAGLIGFGILAVGIRYRD